MNFARSATLLLSMLLAVPAAAEISREDLRKALEANPDLVLSALKKADKMKFFTLVVESQQEYQRGKAKEEARLEAEERDKAVARAQREAEKTRLKTEREAAKKAADAQAAKTKQAVADAGALENARKVAVEDARQAEVVLAGAKDQLAAANVDDEKSWKRSLSL